MSYQRATWHSGLTYRAVCPNCRAYTTYTDHNLGFRMWFPDGFVYCARCNHPIRHRENNAINPDGSPYFPFPIRTPPSPGYVAYPIESLRVYPQYPDPRPNAAGQPVAPSPSPTEEQPGRERRFCYICGREYIRGQAKFCAGCGTMLSDL